MRLVLASGSPRRVELMTAAGYEFTSHAPDIDERHQPGEPPRAYVERLAAEKSARTLEALGSPADVVVIGADTAVVVAGQILGKPRDAEDAGRMLRRLSGREHEVITGVSLRTTLAAVSSVETTKVSFVALSEDQIAWYVASGEGRDKAGAYAIQGLAARFIPRIEGSYSNVVGLPIAVLDGLIRRLSWPPDILASKGE